MKPNRVVYRILIYASASYTIAIARYASFFINPEIILSGKSGHGRRIFTIEVVG
jgi:hypothetical protein